MQVCLTLPVYNEELVLRQNVRSILAALPQNPQIQWSIVIADNGSTDATREVAEELCRELTSIPVQYQYIQVPGKGRALRHVWSTTLADWYFFMDIDLAVELSAVELITQHMLNNSDDILIGSRYVAGARVRRGALRSALSKIYNVLVRHWLSLRVTDAQCGFKAVRHSALQELLPMIKDNYWFFDTELLYLAQQRKRTIREIPVDWVETRSRGRKSKVRLVKTIGDYLWKMRELRRRVGSK